MKKIYALAAFTILVFAGCTHKQGVVVFQTDFGLKDGASGKRHERGGHRG